MTAERPLNAGEWSVLALLCEEPAHGWALATALAQNGDIGALWSLAKPLVYRALDLLEQRGLVEVAGAATSTRGPNRTVYRPTRKGRAALRRWLAEPVGHIREMRPDLLLKLVFAHRSGLDSSALLAAQRVTIEQLAAGLERQLETAAPGRALVLRYRVETARAALRFVEAERSAAPLSVAAVPPRGRR
jgi:DNA-binding PadR family transcriptional regulator